jgi:hypothetical protein
MNSNQCSKLFSDIFDSNCGGYLRICECGITYFDTHNIWDWEDGELEALEQKASDDPEHYVGMDCAIGTMSIDGREIVYGCTCKLAQRYEEFILDHAEQIAQYLNKRMMLLREKANSIEVRNKEGKNG